MPIGLAFISTAGKKFVTDSSSTLLVVIVVCIVGSDFFDCFPSFSTHRANSPPVQMFPIRWLDYFLIQSKKIFWLPVMWPDAKSSAPPCYY
jgi:hypothetical protein